MSFFILLDGKVRKVKDGVSIEQIKERYPGAKKVKVPSVPTLKKWSDKGGCKTPCGCWVEADGECQHGNKSWMIILGLI